MNKYLTRKEEMILLTVYRLGDAASLVKVRGELKYLTGHNWSVGNVYVTLDRLTRLGFLQSVVGEPTSRRGGKAVKYYFVTAQGKEELTELKRVHDRLWEGLFDFAIED
jgi:PadR family transcriptional regulator PadR